MIRQILQTYCLCSDFYDEYLMREDGREGYERVDQEETTYLLSCCYYFTCFASLLHGTVI